MTQFLTISLFSFSSVFITQKHSLSHAPPSLSHSTSLSRRNTQPLSRNHQGCHHQFHFPSPALSPLRPTFPPPRPLALRPASCHHQFHFPPPSFSPLPSAVSSLPYAQTKASFIGCMDYLGKVLVWVRFGLRGFRSQFGFGYLVLGIAY